MSQFGAEIRSRVAAARSSLASAREVGDDYLVELLAGEIESLRRIAADHHVPLDEQQDEDESAA
jgi:hypothetical protein